MRYIPKFQNPSGKLPTYKGKPTTADKVGNYLKRSSQYIAESLPQFGMNIPFDALRDLGVKIPVTMVSPTGYQGSYGTNQTTRQFAKHLVNNAGEAAAIDMGFGVLGKGVQVAAPYVKQGVKNTGNYLLKKSEPYLLGDKTIPMVLGYKPKMNLLFENPVSNNNLNDLLYAKKFADQFGYKLPDNLQNIAKSDKRTDMVIRGLVDRHNSFARGVSTNWEFLKEKSPQILKYLEEAGINYKENPKAAAEYMATFVPKQTGYGRMSLPKEFLNRNQSAIYTSNSYNTAEGYTYGDGYVVKVKRPTDFSSPDRKKWIDNNRVNYIEDGKYNFSTKDFKQALRDGGDRHSLQFKTNILKAERSDKITDPFMYLNSKGINTNKLAEHIKLLGSDPEYLKLKESLNWKNVNFYKVSNQLDDLKKDHILKFMKSNYPDYNPVNNYAHYLHIGPEGSNQLKAIAFKKITPEMWKNTSRSHDNIYSKGLSLAGLIPAVGLYGLTQSKKQGGRLIYKGQKGLTIRPTFDEWYKTVPKQKNDTTFYNLRKAYELAPQEQLDSFVNNPSAHLYSAYQNPKTKIWEFMKSKHHPTLQFELDWFNSNDPEAIEFRKSYDLDTTGEYYKYIPKHINKLIPKAQAGLKWNQRLYNAIDPTLPEIDVPTVAGAGIATALGLNLRNKNKYPVEEAAWKKRLNLPYNKKYLPSNSNGSVRLPDNVASQIVVDTNFVKNRIANQRNQQKYYTETRGYESKALNDMLKVDQAHLDSLRKFYNTGKSVGLNEFGAWKDRDVIDPETGKYKENVVSPLNVLHNFTLYKNPKTKKPMYGDVYDFNWADVLVPGKPYEISGPVK